MKKTEKTGKAEHLKSNDCAKIITNQNFLKMKDFKKSKIEWTGQTWNVVTGCSKISAGCENCYAESIARTLKARGIPSYQNGFEVTLHPEMLNMPKYLHYSERLFVCSMGDLFHKKVPFEFIDKVMDVIELTPRHTFQILTKRPNRMAKYFETRNIPTNAWLGVTVENKNVIHRIDALRNLNATVKFLSCEPLLEDLGIMNLQGIDWIIVGGESGYRARAMKKEWVLNIQIQCYEQNVAFFFKQWGTWGEDGVKRNKKANGKELNGKIYQAMPNVKQNNV
jgi:protein gp37